MTEDKSAGWAAYYDKLRDRPPRRTLLTALDRFGATPADALAIDLGCGDGRDVIEMLRRGWRWWPSMPSRRRCASCRRGPCRPAATSRRSSRAWRTCRCRSASAWSIRASPCRFASREAFHALWDAHPRSAAARRPLQRPMVRPARQLGRPAGHDLPRARRGAGPARRLRARDVRGRRSRRRHAARQRQSTGTSSISLRGSR